MANRKRSVPITFFVNQEEKETIKELAQKKGMTVSTYLRFITLNKEEK